MGKEETVAFSEMEIPRDAIQRCASLYPEQAFLLAQMVKNPPTMQETWVQFLGWEDLLEKGMGTHTSFIAMGESHGQRSLAGYSPWGHKELDMTERLTLSLSFHGPRAGRWGQNPGTTGKP